jgi:ferrous iron transport protein B
MESSLTIGLLGQPNTGKSTLFNRLTGARQHVGNWPGKTVEQKSGEFRADNLTYHLVDLPGTYSLAANSEEELITRDFIFSGPSDLIVVMIDASQIERSMYLLADYAGINLPVVAVLNMMDVAWQNGKKIDCPQIAAKLKIPVVPMVATKKGGTAELMDSLKTAAFAQGVVAPQAMLQEYRTVFGAAFDALLDALPEGGVGNYSAMWLAIKLLEGDRQIIKLVRDTVDSEQWVQIEALIRQNPDGALRAAGCKYEWIKRIIAGNVDETEQVKRAGGKFDKIATHPFFGKPLAILMMILGFAVSMAMAVPFMGLIFGLIPPLTRGTAEILANLGTASFLVSLITEAAIPGTLMTLFMVIYVTGVTLVFGFMEDVGYMARVAYVFDGAMSKIGLHGKAAMPFMMSFGCNIAGITGTRVIDSWQQRLVTLAASWVIPCLAMWGVIGLVGSIFFGQNAIWIIIALFIAAVAHIRLTAWFFGKILLKDYEANGLIMELPPYHKPNWKTIFTYVWTRLKTVFSKSFKVIVGVSVLVWLLSYSNDGQIEHSLIYPIGKFIEPFGALFGLDWRLFMAFLFSIMGKEAALGVISMLYGVGGGISSFAGNMIQGAFQGDKAGLTTVMLDTVSKPAALAFMFAFFFNVPCMAAIASARIETHSLAWTLKILSYYIIVALLIGGIAYRVGMLIF